MSTSSEIFDYLSNDAYARSLGAEVRIPEPGTSVVRLTVRDDMANFHGITHGGLVFTLGDIALGLASNSHGQVALALNVNVTFLKATRAGDQLRAVAREVDASGPTATYEIEVTDESDGSTVARMQGLVYRKRERFAGGDQREGST